MFKRGIALVLVVAVCFATVSCVSTPAPPATDVPAPQATDAPAATATPEPAPPAADQQLTIGISAFPVMGDLNLDSSLFASPFFRLVYDSLFEVDTGQPEPVLVETWKQEDELTWIFTLREGIKFQNGEPLDAESVKWNYERTMNPDTQSRWISWFALVDKVEVVDQLTFRIVTKEPSAILLSSFVRLVLVPPKYFEEVGQEGFNRAPMGTGPYIVTHWSPDDTIVLEANQDYWRGAPTIQTITFKLMPEASARLAALETGEVDIIYGVPPEHIDRLRNRGLVVISNPVGHAYQLPMRNYDDSPLTDPRVRQALNYAVDKDLIIEQLLGGTAVKLEGQIVGSDAVGFDPSLKAYPYDPEKAKQLLAEAGYPDGLTIEFESSAGRYLKDKEVSEAVVSQLAQVGVKAELKILESGVWLDKWLQGTSAPLFNVAISYAPRMDIDQGIVSYITTPGRTRIYKHEELDELYYRQQTEVDAQQRAETQKQMARILYEDPAAIYLFQVPNIAGVSSKVQNLSFNPDYSIKDIINVSIGS